MKHQQQRFHILTLVVAMSSVLAACGGGGDSAGTSAAVSANTSPLAAMQGPYTVACSGDYDNGPGESSQGTLTITAPAGGSEIDVTAHVLDYTGSATCGASALDSDVTVTGQLSSKSATKAYTDSTGKSVTAKVLTFTYSGVTFSKGSFTGSLPMPGVTTDIAYVFDGTNLYVAKGGRGADGLGDKLSPRAGVKQ